MRLSRKAKWSSAGVGVLILLYTAFEFWPFRFRSASVCDQCGAMKLTVVWQLPHSERWLSTRSRIESTTFSCYLESLGLLPAHSHHWLFVEGAGNGVRIDFGEGSGLVGSVHSPLVVRFLELVKQYGEPDEYSKFLRLTLDRNLSPMVQGLAASVASKRFSNREQYRAWMSDDETAAIDREIEKAKQKR